MHNHSIYFTGAEDKHVWSLNLHPGSIIEFDSCYIEFPVQGESVMVKGAVFYLIQGDENYDNWEDDPDDSYSVQHIELTSRCDHVSYQVYKDDIYYLAFFNSMDFPSSLNVQFKVNRTKYQFSPDTVVNNCTIAVNSHSSCSVSLPLSPSYTVLLELDTTLPVDWDDGVTVVVKCLPRGWLYAVIILCIALFLLSITVSILVMCMCAYLKQRGRRKAYNTIPESEPSLSINNCGRPPAWWYRDRSRSLSKIQE